MANTGLIRIVRMPAGEAPPWVRQAWVGLTLPCCSEMAFFPSSGVVTDKPVKDRLGVSVPHKEALEILKKRSPKAASWWKSSGFPKQPPNDCFMFSENEVKIVSGV
ncbi:MAG: hypothetical protein NTY04_01510, partial [Candidatus Staskawiczbacteria bacterium]|nr:hypothetical protein [Candidatus Staskawiczbacteria bacterium]